MLEKKAEVRSNQAQLWMMLIWTSLYAMLHATRYGQKDLKQVRINMKRETGRSQGFGFTTNWMVETFTHGEGREKGLVGCAGKEKEIKSFI